MKPEKLITIKRELSGRSVHELTDLCLRLAKYKKENKELLNYLLFDADDPLMYAGQVKVFLEDDFKTLQKHSYYSTKSLRKILRIINRHAKYTASKTVELELLIWFCNNFLTYADTKSSHKPLHAIFTRQFQKIQNLIPKLHEDLAFDYQNECNQLVDGARKQLRWFDK
ncbi:MAG TPA: hypothetical protein VNI52_08195 [Sphingobacteriaceae bacterium]|nr:hypothetical protein [Sphingobacteriaceae bacterium]